MRTRVMERINKLMHEEDIDVTAMVRHMILIGDLYDHDVICEFGNELYKASNNGKLERDCGTLTSDSRRQLYKTLRTVEGYEE